MRPTLNLDFRYGARDIRIALQSPIQGFDSLRIISQMVSLQCLHYLILALILPFLLAIVPVNQSAINFQGGRTSLSMVLDWREIAGISTQEGSQLWSFTNHNLLSQTEKDYLQRAKLNTSVVEDMGGMNRWWDWDAYLQSDSLHWMLIGQEDIAWDGKRPGRGSMNGAGLKTQEEQVIGQDPPWWSMYARDPRRGWVILLAWTLTGVADVFLLSILIRRPTHILDHTLTLHLFHFILTSFYTRALPTSLFYWLAMLAHAGACVVWAEALSIRREMHTGWTSGWEDSEIAQGNQEEEEERSGLLVNPQAPTMRQSGHRPTTHVLFEGDEEEEDDEGEDSKRNEKGANGHGHENIEMKRMN